MSDDQLSALLGRLDAIDKIAGLLKLVVCGIVGAAVWATTMQLQVSGNSKTLEEIRSDRKAALTEWWTWRTDTTRKVDSHESALNALAMRKR